MASYLETAVEIAREAGALLSTYFERRVAFELKGDFDLVTDDEIASAAKIKKASDGRSIMVPGVFDERRRAVALLALSFAAGSQGNLVVPYARGADA